jgi:hypothetical protein
MKELNYLLGFKNIKIYQDKDYFKFSLDSILLANFCKIKNKNQKILDIGTGTCPIPLLLSNKYENLIIAIEIQKNIYNLAKESVFINHKENQIKLINIDIKDYKSGKYDIILSNPPYYKIFSNSKLNLNEVKSIARHEITLTLEDLIKNTKRLLENKGEFYIIYPTERFIELIIILNKYNLIPKVVKFVYPKKNTDSNLFLLKAINGGKEGLKILPPLFIHKQNGEYYNKIKKEYFNDGK